MIATRTWFEIQGVTVDTTYVIGTIDDNDWVIIDLRVYLRRQWSGGAAQCESHPGAYVIAS